MILQIIINNGILDLVTGIFGPNLGWELEFGTPLHDPLDAGKNRGQRSN